MTKSHTDADFDKAMQEQGVPEVGFGNIKQEQGEPVAHCEAGPEYCQQCYKETPPTYGSEEVRKLREVIASQAKIIEDHIPDTEKMVDVLREIGDFAHDKSTGPAVLDALWEIRSIAYNAIVEFELMMNIATPQQRKPLTKQQRIEIIESLEFENSQQELIDAVEAAHGIKE
jgi:hypothetical protein